VALARKYAGLIKVRELSNNPLANHRNLIAFTCLEGVQRQGTIFDISLGIK
jgi:hypothetical protein